MFGFQDGIHKLDVRIANREVPDETASLQKQSDLGLHCLSRLFLQASSVQNFRTFTVYIWDKYQIYKLFGS